MLCEINEPLYQPFTIQELELALALSDRLFRGTRVSVVTDHEMVPEAIAVTPPRVNAPQWFICKCGERRILVANRCRGRLGKCAAHWITFDDVDGAVNAIRIALAEG